MSVTLLTLAIFAVTAIFIYRHVRLGYKRGLSKTLITLAVLLFSALIGAALSPLLSGLIVEGIVLLLKFYNIYDTLIAPVAGYMSVILIVIKTFVSILVYLPVFFLLRLITALVIKLVYSIVVKKGEGRKPKYKSEDADDYVKREKSIAAAIGAISGVMLAIIVFMPLTCGLKTANSAVEVAQGLLGEEMFPETRETRSLKKYSKDASASVINILGGDALFDMTTRISYEGHTSCIDNELAAIEAVDVEQLMIEFSDTEGSTIDKIVAVEPLLNNINDTVVVKMLVIDVIKEVSLSWMDYEDYMGIPRPVLGEQKSMDRFLDSLLLVCSTTTFESYEANVTTLLNITKIVCEYEGLFATQDYQEFIKSFSESNALSRIEAELDSNPYMGRVEYAINDMLMSTIVSELNILDKYPESTKNELYKALAKVLNDTKDLSGSAKNVELTRRLTESFEAKGITVPDGISERIAEAMEQGVPSMDGKITAREVESYLNQYK